MGYEINDIIVWIGNLFPAGALFLYVCKRKGKRPGMASEGQEAGDAKGAGLSAIIGLLLEFAVYSAGVVRLIGLIMQEIEADGEGSLMMLGVRILFTESMLALFLVLRMLYAGREKKRDREQDRKQDKERDSHGLCAFVGKEGESALAMLLLLALILGNFREAEAWKAFGLQLLYLLLFFVLLYLKRRRHGQQAGDGQGELAVQQQRQDDYFKNVDIQYQRTRELWHDLKNHIGVLEILAKEGRLPELADYLNSFRRDVEIRMIPTKTGCTAVDALLSDKLYHARRKEIEVSVQVCDLSEMTIPATDLCAVLGNLLDNAIEACGRLAGKGRIELRLKQQEDFYYLTVLNTAPEPVRQGEGFVSGKKGYDNGVGHGLGLRSVERIAHQYGGSMVTDYQCGEFKVVVRLQDF